MILKTSIRSENQSNGWRAYQSRLQKERQFKRRNQRLRKNRKFFILIPLVFFAICGLIAGSVGSHPYRQGDAAAQGAKAAPPQQGSKLPQLAKADIQKFINPRNFLNHDKNIFEVRNNQQRLMVQTSIDLSLQNYLASKLDLKNSRHIGIVAMDPDDGRILAMVGYDKTDATRNPCTDINYPAASIFKIITAAAALENCALNPDSELYYNGRKHTLYKNQINTKINKYTNRISLKDSFAKSVNPVFGKLGALDLGKGILETYAKAFGFNSIIDFELPLLPSRTEISDKPYDWAEIASGFNRRTQISALHGALISAIILNRGKLIEPTIVDLITDEQGRELYKNHSVTIEQVISPKTSDMVYELMLATVASGTARREFRKFSRDKILSQLEIGGKTGSINNRTNDARYDWFVGYAKEKAGNGKIVLSVVVAHEKYIGIRATRYARMAMQKYFKDFFAAATASPPNPSSEKQVNLMSH